MDIRTGEIHVAKNVDELQKRLGMGREEFEALIKPFDPKKMKLTPKQVQEQRVSTRDTRSPLGRLRQNAIRRIGRNSPCPCGSGHKFKKCCLGGH